MTMAAATIAMRMNMATLMAIRITLVASIVRALEVNLDLECTMYNVEDLVGACICFSDRRVKASRTNAVAKD